MVDTSLYISLGATRYVVDSPMPQYKAGPYLITDVCCEPSGHVLVLVRRISFKGQFGPAVFEYDAEGTLVGEWGEEIIDAHRLAIGPDGQILIVDRDSHVIVVYDRNRKAIQEIGRRGFSGKPFSNPTDVAVASTGEIFVTDGYGAAKIHRLSAEGELLQTFGTLGRTPTDLLTPHAVAIMPADAHGPERLAICDRDNSRICIYGLDGQFIAAWDPFFLPMDIALMQDGSLLVSDQIPRFTLLGPDGAVLGSARGMPTLCHGVYPHPDGSFFSVQMSSNGLSRMRPVGTSDEIS